MTFPTWLIASMTHYLTVGPFLSLRGCWTRRRSMIPTGGWIIRYCHEKPAPSQFPKAIKANSARAQISQLTRFVRSLIFLCAPFFLLLFGDNSERRFMSSGCVIENSTYPMDVFMCSASEHWIYYGGLFGRFNYCNHSFINEWKQEQRNEFD